MALKSDDEAVGAAAQHLALADQANQEGEQAEDRAHRERQQLERARLRRPVGDILGAMEAHQQVQADRRDPR